VARGGLSALAKVDFKKPRPPLLLIAGAKDHFIPSPVNKANYRRYKASPSATDFKEFPGRTHFIIGQAGWEEVADYVLNWLHQQKLLANGASTTLTGGIWSRRTIRRSRPMLSAFSPSGWGQPPWKSNQVMLPWFLIQGTL